MLFARPARAGVVAADLRAEPHERLTRRGVVVIMAVVAVWSVHMLGGPVIMARMAMLGQDCIRLGGQRFVIGHRSALGCTIRTP
jgi:hypothetical protein